MLWTTYYVITDFHSQHVCKCWLTNFVHNVYAVFIVHLLTKYLAQIFYGAETWAITKKDEKKNTNDLRKEDIRDNFGTG